MFNFFKTCSYILMVSLALASSTFVADIFINHPQRRFALFNVAFALLFIGFALLWQHVYKNFKSLYVLQHQIHYPNQSLKRLLLIFGIVAAIMAIICLGINGVLWQRMDNYAIFG